MSTVTESAGTVQMHHTLFTDAVNQVSALAQVKLPESLHGRIQRATALVLSGGVFVEEDGCTTHVRCTNGFYAVNGHCPCPDAARAQDGYCKHRLAKAIYHRTPVPLPEAPASVNVHLTVGGRQVQLTLRDTDEGRLLARLDAVLQRFPVDATPADTTPQCPKHGVPLKLNHGKDGRTWYSHKTADGWCKGR